MGQNNMTGFAIFSQQLVMQVFLYTMIGGILTLMYIPTYSDSVI